MRKESDWMEEAGIIPGDCSHLADTSNSGDIDWPVNEATLLEIRIACFVERNGKKEKKRGTRRRLTWCSKNCPAAKLVKEGRKKRRSRSVRKL